MGRGEKVGAIIAYSFCSATMLVVNKIAVQQLPVPTLVSGTQLLFSSCFVLALHALGLVTLPAPNWKTLQPFAVYTTSFAAGIYANINALELTSVGVVIAARSCLPILVVLLETLFMGRQLPSARSRLALLGVLSAALVYVHEDAKLAVQGGSAGWVWLLIWWFLLAFQMAYGKHITVAVKMDEHERVFFTNALSVPPTVALCFIFGEQRKLAALTYTTSGLSWLALSWLIGIGISYSGWRLKELVTATTFTLVGVLNKMATIALSSLAFPGSTSLRGGLALTICILFGLAYRDAPMKATSASSSSGGHTSLDLSKLAAAGSLREPSPTPSLMMSSRWAPGGVSGRDGGADEGFASSRSYSSGQHLSGLGGRDGEVVLSVAAASSTGGAPQQRSWRRWWSGGSVSFEDNQPPSPQKGGKSTREL